MDSFGRNSIIRDINEEFIPGRHVAAKYKMTEQPPDYSSETLAFVNYSSY